MKVLTKSIREATGLSMDQFCRKYLESDWRTFAARERKKRLNPNEALLICLVTGKNPLELFGMSTIELFCLQGKEVVTKHIQHILKEPDALNKINLILNNADGLRLNPAMEEKPVRPRRVEERPIKMEPKSVTKKVKNDDFDFVADVY